jgi:hypothetical protein
LVRKEKLKIGGCEFLSEFGIILGFLESMGFQFPTTHEI